MVKTKMMGALALTALMGLGVLSRVMRKFVSVTYEVG